MTLEKWLDEYIDLAVRNGMPRRQAERYREDHLEEATTHYHGGRSPGDAVTIELLGELPTKED